MASILDRRHSCGVVTDSDGAAGGAQHHGAGDHHGDAGDDEQHGLDAGLGELAAVVAFRGTVVLGRGALVGTLFGGAVFGGGVFTLGCCVAAAHGDDRCGCFGLGCIAGGDGQATLGHVEGRGDLEGAVGRGGRGEVGGVAGGRIDICGIAGLGCIAGQDEDRGAAVQPDPVMVNSVSPAASTVAGSTVMVGPSCAMAVPAQPAETSRPMVMVVRVLRM